MVNRSKSKILKDIADILRRDSLKMTSAAVSGHPTSCLSSAEIISTLFFSEMRYDTKNAFNPDNDEFILSKGHAAPILYSALFHAGCITENLLNLRKISSVLEGHPKPSSRIPWIKFATGSLGQGLSVGAGMALAGKLQKRNFKVFVLLGDSEVAEGSVYEAMEISSYYNLDNLVAILDMNRLGQRGETMLGHRSKEYEKRFNGFGWNTITIDGHNINEILKALKKTRNSKKPTIIIAKTIKGKGVSFLEDENGWHGKALKGEQLKKALEEIPERTFPEIKIIPPKKTRQQKKSQSKKIPIPTYFTGEIVAVREGYGNGLSKLALSDRSVIAIDAEVSNSTYSEKVKEKTPNQFVEAYIAEQNMIGMAQGLSIKGFKVFASSFAAFLTRAHDQIRMAGISSSNISICGSHAGISIGKDGPSQMGLEDIGMFRAIPESKVFYPSDAVSAEKLTVLASKLKGIKYIRSTREKTPIIYKNRESFKLGDFKVLRESKRDEGVLVGAGITLHECLKAYQKLKACGKKVAVVDLYCIKPFNSRKFREFVRKHGKQVLVVEDHYPEGGIGEMILNAIKNTDISMRHLAVNKLPRSGRPEKLMKKFGIDSDSIVKEILK